MPLEPSILSHLPEPEMTISRDWTSQERLRLMGTIATHAVEKIQTGQMPSQGTLRALETISQLQTMPHAFLETHRRQILKFCGQQFQNNSSDGSEMDQT